MASSKETERRQRRRELDARRSKFRVRLGSWPESWSTLKDQLGFSMHSELANFLLNSYSSSSRCLGDLKNMISVTVASLHQLILLIHSHAQCCPLTPSLQTEDPTGSRSSEAEMCLKISCNGGHMFTWCPSHPEPEEAHSNGDEQMNEATGQNLSRERGGEAKKCQPKLPKLDQVSIRSRRRRTLEATERGEKNKTVQPKQDVSSREGSDADLMLLSPKISTASPDNAGVEAENRHSAGDENPKPPDRLQTEKDEASQISRKRMRKPAPKLILPCEFANCSKIFSTRQYLNHHMKYQHVHQKTFICSHPSCGKSFNFKKHLKEHEKLHSDQRDYICEFCARAFRTSSNLSIHRRIHTGEKPLQCEVCGYTCRQKASLNWHMRKHDSVLSAATGLEKKTRQLYPNELPAS